MNFGNILKRTWKISWNKKNLWWLGFFALFTEAGLESSTFYQLPAIPTSEDKAVAAASNLWSGFSSIFSSPTLVTVVSLIVVAIFIFILFISYSAKAGLILAADKLEEGKIDSKPVARHYFREGKEFTWKILLLNIVLAITSFIVLVLVISPFIPLIMSLEQNSVIMVFVCLMVIAIALLLVFSISIAIIKQLGERIIVLEKSNVLHALSRATKILLTNIGNVLLTWLISLGIQIGFSMVSFLAFFFAGLVAVVISGLFYFLLNSVGLIISAIICGLVVLVAAFVVLGGFSTYNSTYWTLSYKELLKAEKTEE